MSRPVWIGLITGLVAGALLAASMPVGSECQVLQQEVVLSTEGPLQVVESGGRVATRVVLERVELRDCSGAGEPLVVPSP